MTETQYRRWNSLLSWAVFLIALITYHLTVEPTASFWDAGEYIATSAKLQVGHPPGAPFFQMAGAVISIFASDPEHIAYAVNHLSVVSSAFAVFFLFLTSSHILEKLSLRLGGLTEGRYLAILGSSLLGSLTFTFTDSFWFNAVETEVYAMATLFLTALFWMGLKWVDALEEPRGNRWLILISLVIGLSFGVHFMALLAIPALGMLYFFKTTKEPTVKSFILANVISIGILLVLIKLLLPFVLKYFGYLEVFFVNSIGLPFNSGTIIAALVLIALFWYALRYTQKAGLPATNSIILCILFVLIGFSSWLMLPIRANAGTVINENSPTDARQLLAYYNLEQYPETKLLYGPMYTDAFAGQDPDDPYKDDKPKYERDYEAGKYIVVNKYENARVAPNSDHVGFLPRMWSSDHAENYMKITGPAGISIKPEYRGNAQLKAAVDQFKNEADAGILDEGEYLRFIRQFSEFINVEKPTLWQNLHYLFEYQMGYMYWRYLMWNFTGRQDDIQGKLDNHGNWISGIAFLDELRVGPQENLPSDVKNNKGRNTYFFLPFILGLFGLIFLYRSSKQYFWVLMVLFLFTGLALKVYLLERPFEPRERDYAVVGSFYVFSIWIGMAVFALAEELKRLASFKILVPVITSVCLLISPVLLASQNWDDHDRSNRYTAQAMAKSYLDSIQEDAGAILFTIGDNDTFSLWYAQEIEGYRTDVRTVNTSLFATDWYIDQMKRKAYESDPVPSQLTHDKYAYGIRDAVYFQPLTEERWDIKRFMDWISNDKNNLGSLIRRQGGDVTQYPENYLDIIFYPTNKIRVPVNKENVLASGLVKPEDADKIVPYIDIDLPESALPKNRILMLDLLANNDWKRPIYFTGGSFDKAEYLWMKEYLQLDGLVYKLVPIHTPIDPRYPYEMGRIDEDLMYDIVMGWEWGNMDSPDIYHDPETRKNSISFRGNLARLIEKLLAKDKTQKAEDILDLAMAKMPFGYFGYYVFLEPFINGYYQVDEPEKARKLFEDISKKYQEYLTYYSGMPESQQYLYGAEIVDNMERYRNLVDILIINQDRTYAQEQAATFNSYLERFRHFYGDEEGIEDLGPEQPEDSMGSEMPPDSLRSADGTETDTTAL